MFVFQGLIAFAAVFAVGLTSSDTSADNYKMTGTLGYSWRCGFISSCICMIFGSIFCCFQFIQNKRQAYHQQANGAIQIAVVGGSSTDQPLQYYTTPSGQIVQMPGPAQPILLTPVTADTK